MIKKLIVYTGFLLFIFLPTLTNAQTSETTITTQTLISPSIVELFYSATCPHCAKEEIFLEKLERKYIGQVNFFRYEVTLYPKNVEKLMDIKNRMQSLDISGVPITIINEKYAITGYNSDETTGAQIENYIQKALSENSASPIEPITQPDEPAPQPTNDESHLEKFQVPLIGTVNLKLLSLPAVTVIIGVLDGFNPCAMWTLLFLISLLIGMHDRKKMWILGTAFIVASASVYFVFMTAWLNIILFLGFIFWIRILIGLVALGGGVINIREFIKNKHDVCKVTDTEKRKKIFDRIKEIINRDSFWLALGGIVLLAFAVNLVELICSAGLPAIYSQILILNKVSPITRYLYILLYLFFFMLDDMLIFMIAMMTLKVTGISTKYTRLSHIIGGILMLIVGILLIFKPEWLMFA